MVGNNPSIPTTISLVRHGHVYNPENITYGRLPGFRISQMGREQARAAAIALHDTPLAAAFCSPQLRARQTAELILAGHDNLTLAITPLIDEVHMPFEGISVNEMIDRKWDVYTGTGPEYEQPVDLLTRMRKFITEARQQYAGRHVLAITHGDPIAFMMLWASDIPAGPENKQALTDLGLSDSYPAPASITTFVYQTTAEDEVPEFSYVRPY